MVGRLWQKSLSLLFKQQTNILSAAFIIMLTVILSQLLGLIRQRLLVAIFGASNTLGAYFYSSQLPTFLFQLIIAGALASAFIPVFSGYLVKKDEVRGHAFASHLLCIGLISFAIVSIPLLIFSEFFSHLIAPGVSGPELQLIANLMRIIIIGQLFFIIGSFLSAILQSYNHFFIPGFALAFYNFGIIVGILTLAPTLGIYSAAWGVVIGSLFFVILQLPFSQRVGFRFRISVWSNMKEVREVLRLMWPRTLSIAIFQLGVVLTGVLVSLIPNGGRSYVIYDFAQTLAFAPVGLFGMTIAQAAFPILSRQKDTLDSFKSTFITSFNQMLYIILPISVLFLVLRIPIVRLIYGASRFDWAATVLTGRTLAYFSISIFAQALVLLVARAFYALHDTKTPLVIGALTTLFMVALGWYFILIYNAGVVSIRLIFITLHFGVESIAFAYSIASIVNLLILLVLLNKKTGGFMNASVTLAISKIFFATLCTGFALYVPIKLLDKLVFDTTKTVNLITLTGISSLIGLSLYLFLTWLLSVEEAETYIAVFKKIGNWRDILKKTEEPLDGTTLTP